MAGFFSRLKEGLSKTRNNIVRGIDSVFSGFSSIDEEFYEELEEILIMGDIGVNATGEILERLKGQVKENHIKEPSECKSFLIESIKEQMRVDETAYRFEQEQSVVLVIGVNGVGKTTSVGKLAGILKGQGKKVLIADYMGVIADTLFSAPMEQINIFAAWLGAAAYMLQIYFDFSGYSDMAIGLGHMFGFHFRENFRYPYGASSGIFGEDGIFPYPDGFGTICIYLLAAAGKVGRAPASTN